MSDRETGRSIGERIIRATVVVGIAHVIFKLISVVARPLLVLALAALAVIIGPARLIDNIPIDGPDARA